MFVIWHFSQNYFNSIYRNFNWFGFKIKNNFDDGGAVLFQAFPTVQNDTRLFGLPGKKAL